MVQLVAHMFEARTSRDPNPPPFGLENGQKRDRSTIIVPDAVWFNHMGERLGRGDISVQDCEKITKEIHEDGFFVIMRIGVCVKPGAMLPKKASDHVDSNLLVDTLPQDFMAKNAAYVVCKDRLFVVDPKENDTSFKRNGLVFKTSTPDVLLGKFRAFTPATA